jgi:hypothetical protein
MSASAVSAVFRPSIKGRQQSSYDRAAPQGHVSIFFSPDYIPAVSNVRPGQWDKILNHGIIL